MTTELSRSSSWLSSNHKFKYDVLISFEKEDTGRNFTGHLYKALENKGIHLFGDIEMLMKGKVNSSEILNAIQISKYVIIVFSKNYAFSTDRLDELAKIVDCKNLESATVVPIFYHVDPSHVRKQEGKIRKAIAKHEKSQCPLVKEKITKWTSALTQIANLSGYDLKNQHETEVIQKIAKTISKRLNPASVYNDLIGTSSRVETFIKSYLAKEPNQVHIVGIWGIGGIGKTTIAKQVFNEIHKQFEASCFVANVREEAENNINGLVHLQKHLQQHLVDSNEYIPTTDVGKNVLRQRLVHKKVLIVLDDVDKLKQLETLAVKTDQNLSLGPGSIIIVTTRDKSLLIGYGVKDIYEVEKLSDNEARELFCHKAFKKNQDIDCYRILFKQVIDYAEGLPFVLEHLGTSLHGKEIDEWSDELARIVENCPKDIMNRLKRSYDDLESLEKETFLKIAGFLKDNIKDRDRVKAKLLEGYGIDMEHSVRVLVNKSLITIDENNQVWMHGLFRRMSEHILHQQSGQQSKSSGRASVDRDGSVMPLQDMAALPDQLEAVPLIVHQSPMVSSELVDFCELDNLFAKIKKLMDSSIVPKDFPSLVQTKTSLEDLDKPKKMLQQISSWPFEELIQTSKRLEFQTKFDTLLAAKFFPAEIAITISIFLADLSHNIEAYSSAKELIKDANNLVSSIEESKEETEYLSLEYSKTKQEKCAANKKIEQLYKELVIKKEKKQKLDKEVKNTADEAKSYQLKLALAVEKMPDVEVKKSLAEREVCEREFAWDSFKTFVNKYNVKSYISD